MSIHISTGAAWFATADVANRIQMQVELRIGNPPENYPEDRIQALENFFFLRRSFRTRFGTICLACSVLNRHHENRLLEGRTSKKDEPRKASQRVQRCHTTRFEGKLNWSDAYPSEHDTVASTIKVHSVRRTAPSVAISGYTEFTQVAFQLQIIGLLRRMKQHPHSASREDAPSHCCGCADIIWFGCLERSRAALRTRLERE